LTDCTTVEQLLAEASRDAEVVREPGRRLIVICDEGYQSSLAAATLQRFGFTDATDVIGGFQASKAAGFDVHDPPNGR
jgi:rhodanese-related sulfurtransferase